MVKFVALWRKADDPEAFENWYTGQHIPLCRAYPDTRHVHVGRVTGSPRGESDFAWVFEAVYDDRDTMMASLMSEKGMASAMDARGSGFGGLMTAMFVELD